MSAQPMMPSAAESRVAPGPDRAEIDGVLTLAFAEVRAYLERIDDAPALSSRVDAAAQALDIDLPERGIGAAAALRALVDRGLDAAASTYGPRFFHFVVGGVTPAALGADLLAAALDQPAYAWASSPLGVQAEVVSLRWLKELFGLPAAMSGVMTTGATMANFVGLAAARQWWGERHGLDPAADGLSGAPRVPVLTSGFVHASAIKCLSMLGIGRTSATQLSADARGSLDAIALERALEALDGAPAIVIANAGEVNYGGFDPIDAMADLCERYDAWLHVDGAFGLFARLAPATRHLAAGVERAHSVTVDGHKWLNVPYDCGFSFVRDEILLRRAFAYSADYLPSPDDPRPNFGSIGPESSRRARALAVWTTLLAYGRDGYRSLVERHLALAQHLAAQIDAAPDLERLDDVPLNIVCFRYNPGGLADDALDALNTQLGRAIVEDGRVIAGTTRHGGRVALRPALSNWRTREADIDLLVDVARELGARAARELRSNS